MKNFIILIFMALSMASCTMDKDLPEVAIPLQSGLTTNDFEEIGFELKRTVSERGNTRAEDTFEEIANDPEAIKIFKPLVDDGAQIVQQLNLQSELLTQEDLDFYNSMTDDQLAILSLVAVAYGCAEEDSTLPTRSVDMGRVRSCLAFALGVSQIKNLAVSGVVTATTLRAAIVAIGKRYLGYVGVALMVWDFYDCFN